METTNKFIEPTNYGIDCEPVFHKSKLTILKNVLKNICSIYVTGRGILTFDASLPKFRGKHNDALRAAKWASITQPILCHLAIAGCSGIFLFNGRIVGKEKLTDLGERLSRIKLP